jgi:cell wall-associated NlpC family hydrolase
MEATDRGKQRKWIQIGLTLTLLLGLSLEAACTQSGKGSSGQSSKGGQSKSAPSAKSAKGNNKGSQNQSKATAQGSGAQQGAKQGDQQGGQQGQNQGQLPLVTQGGMQYVKAKQLVELLGFQSKWNSDNSSYQIGDKDVILELTMNSRQAQNAEDSIKLASPPIIINQNAYIPVSALGDLFKQDMNFTVTGNQLKVLPQPQSMNSLSMQSTGDNKTQDQYLNFTDDPDDPNKQQSQPTLARSTKQTAMYGLIDEDSLPVSLQKINIAGLVRESRKYLGVKYIFGAKPYNQSGGFDCSSYTQYLFGKYGVSLPRVSRDQAKQGVTIGRNDLRVGDLVFFNVPGRFKSNTAVGHVGIYIGNNEMINANNQPKFGVQITNINKPYWKRVYLYAKRVAA